MRVCVFAGLLCDLLWSDPDKDVQGWGENDRGVSFTFGADVVSKFLNRHDLDLICRAHQVTKLLSVSGIHSRVTFHTHYTPNSSSSISSIHSVPKVMISDMMGDADAVFSGFEKSGLV